MHADNVRRTRLLRISTVLLAFALAFVPQSVGQVLVNETICHLLGNREIVLSAREQIKDGASIESVTNALSCVVRNRQCGSRLKISAVRVGFAIQNDDAKARRFLLAIIRDPQAVAKPLAWELLTYVADEEAGSAMFEVFLDKWPSRQSPMYFERLRALKSQEFLVWLDTRIQLRDHAPVPRVMLEMEAEMIRVQQNGEQVLQYITSPEHPILHRAWLTRHALRCGLTRGDLRDAFLPMFQQQAAGRGDWFEQSELLKALDELQVFREGGIDLLKPLRDDRTRTIICNAGSSGPRWAEEIIATKRATFLRVPEAQGSGK